MKYIDEFRNKHLVFNLSREISEVSRQPIVLMEVCGGHTMAIHRFGIPSLLPANITLLSGPGCPVCVTSRGFIDHAIALSRLPGVMICTYGDLIRVPGSTSTLGHEKAKGSDIRIVYSAMDSMEIAVNHPDKKVIFLGIGFETTTPASAAAVLAAHTRNISNFYLLSSHKVMPPAMTALIDEGIKLNGYLAPGHVSTITGSSIYEEITARFRVGCVISGFEPTDIMESILMLVKQFESGAPKVEIQYRRAVRPEGNLKARQLVEKVFEPMDDWWRGLGILKESGLKIKPEFSRHDAGQMMDVFIEPTREDKGCICGNILKGLNNPKDCVLFDKVCNPLNPVGACMVSGEGACHAHYRYNR